ncbi:MAG: GDP-mannose 4,6-dehydratase, partial [bacterium]|nr:GDP-mannose 4,6-dehydratase [bacterium]
MSQNITHNPMKESNHKTILIAGGAGFIGSHLVAKYLVEGHRVIVVDNLQTTWKPKNIERFFSHPNFRFVRQDVIQPLKLKER